MKSPQLISVLLGLILLVSFDTSNSSALFNTPEELLSVFLEGRCARQSSAEIPIGGSCGGGNRCVGDPTCSTCLTGTCTCKEGFKVDSEGLGMCVGAQRIGGSCLSSLPEQCVAYHNGTSACISAFCQCIADHYPSGDFQRCLQKTDDLGGPCEEDVQCHEGLPGEHSQCFENVCQCQPGSVSEREGNVCFKIPDFIGDPCEVPIQCEVLRGQCTAGRCQCGPNFVVQPDLRSCLEKRDKVGEDQECEDDVQCIENSHCYAGPGLRGACMCDVGFTSTPENDTCYRLAEYVGDPCIPNDPRFDQCSPVERSVCDSGSGTCRCPANHVASLNNRKCLPLRSELDEPCEENHQCMAGNSVCDRERCQCRNGFVGIDIPGRNAECVEVRKEVNLHCEYDMQCTAGLGELAYCHDDVCQCRPPYGYMLGGCHIPAKLGEPCEVAEQCFISVNRLAFCSRQNDTDIRRCECRPDAFQYNDKCYSRSLSKLGEACDTDFDCRADYDMVPGGRHAECNELTSTCVLGNQEPVVIT